MILDCLRSSTLKCWNRHQNQIYNICTAGAKIGLKMDVYDLEFQGQPSRLVIYSDIFDILDLKNIWVLIDTKVEFVSCSQTEIR